jgi:hypothetical protein
MRAAIILLSSALALGAGAARAADSTPQPQTSTTSQPIPSLWPEESDADGDNRISRDEAMLLSSKTYTRYDFDGDGSISVLEWRRVIDDRVITARQRNAGVKIPADMEVFTSKTFDTHDVDNDGMISRAEWDNRVTQHFAQIDANGDGTIDEPEAGAIVKGQKKGD